MFLSGFLDCCCFYCRKHAFTSIEERFLSKSCGGWRKMQSSVVYANRHRSNWNVLLTVLIYQLLLQNNDDNDGDDKLFWGIGRPMKVLRPYFQLTPFSEVLTITNL